MTRRIRIAHSPDSDDAFMFAGLKLGKVETGPYEVVHELKDNEALNQMALLHGDFRHEMVDGGLAEAEVARLGIQAVPSVFAASSNSTSSTT